MTEIDPLTRRVYDYVAQFLKDKQYSPTLREIGKGCRITHSTVFSLLNRLEGMEWLVREYGVSRSIRLGRKAPDYVPPDDTA